MPFMWDILPYPFLYVWDDPSRNVSFLTSWETVAMSH